MIICLASITRAACRDHPLHPDFASFLALIGFRRRLKQCRDSPLRTPILRANHPGRSLSPPQRNLLRELAQRNVLKELLKQQSALLRIALGVADVKKLLTSPRDCAWVGVWSMCKNLKLFCFLAYDFCHKSRSPLRGSVWWRLKDKSCDPLWRGGKLFWWFARIPWAHAACTQTHSTQATQSTLS